MAEIFLSYRRADAAAAAGRLYDALVRNFGAAQVFRDLDSIEAGEDFEHRIRGALADAVAGLVVIGPDALIQETNADQFRASALRACVILAAAKRTRGSRKRTQTH